MLFIRATILTSMSPSPSTRSQSVDISWLSFWPGFVTSFNRQSEELIYIPYSSFNGQSLGPVKTRRGRENWSYLAPLSGRPRDKCSQSRPGFELVSPCPFPTTITITPRAPPKYFYLTLIILFNPIHFFAHSQMVPSIDMYHLWFN